MYKPKRIIIKNIGPIENIEYDFQIGKSLLIQGRNLDNQGQRNNGVGKTFFIDSIAFAITGLTLSGRSMEEFIQDNANEAYIEFSLTHSINSHEFVIKRYLNRKKPQLIEFSIGGKDLHGEYPDVNQRNEFIIKEIGISKEDLFQFFLISKDRYKPYFKFSDTDKKNVTARFSNADIVDQVQPRVEVEVTQLQSKERQLNIEIARLTTQIESYSTFITELESKYSDSHKAELKLAYIQRIEEIQAKMSQIDENEVADEIEELTKNLEVFKKQLENQRAIVEELGQSIDLKEANIKTIENNFDVQIQEEEKKLSNLEKEKLQVRQEVNQSFNTLNEIQKLIKQVDAELQTSISCPSCEHEFILDSKNTVEELQKHKADLEVLQEGSELDYKQKQSSLQVFDSKIADQIKAITAIKTQRDTAVREIRTELAGLERQETLVKNLIKQLRGERDSCSLSIESKERYKASIKQTIADSEKEIQMYFSKIDEVDTLDNKEQIQEYSKLITDSQEKLENHVQDLEETQEKIANNTQWGLRFKAFKSYLVNQSLKHIQNLMNSFLSEMNTDLSVEIEGFKQKGKKVSEKITETILRSGIPIGSYSKFSGGERGRIDIGSILANQTLINNKAENGLDLILIDEVLESVDEEGIKNIVQSMENIDKTMLLITQNEINTLPNQVITFEKQNGKLQVV